MRARYFRRFLLLAVVLLVSAIGSAISLWHLGVIRHGPPPSGYRGVVPLLFLAAIFVFAAAALALARMLGRAGGPLRAVMEAADQVAGGHYDVRVAEIGPPPIRALARAFNTMTARLQRQDRMRRDLMADVAHELRTPLTVIQGRLEGMLDGVYPLEAGPIGEALEEIHVLSRLVEDLRTLALSESGALTLQKESTDLAALARETASAFSLQAAERGVSLDVSAPAPATLDVDPVRIRQVLNNLLSNALRHTPPGGSVIVQVDVDPRRVSLQVRDTGSGMTAAELERAFDRFQKGPASRGSGLGLAIARSLITVHGGELEAASEPGRGTTMTVTLPR